MSKTNHTSQNKTNTAPQSETNIVPQSEANITPQNEDSNVPQSTTDTTPQSKTSNVPQREVLLQLVSHHVIIGYALDNGCRVGRLKLMSDMERGLVTLSNGTLEPNPLARKGVIPDTYIKLPSKTKHFGITPAEADRILHTDPFYTVPAGIIDSPKKKAPKHPANLEE